MKRKSIKRVGSWSKVHACAVSSMFLHAAEEMQSWCFNTVYIRKHSQCFVDENVSDPEADLRGSDRLTGHGCYLPQLIFKKWLLQNRFA